MYLQRYGQIYKLITELIYILEKLACVSAFIPICVLGPVGRPIPVVKNKEPTAEELDALHQLYMEELSNLFDEHKGSYGIDKDTHLNFV